MANSKSVSAGGTATSDALTIPADVVQIAIESKADNDGTPASGDTITMRLLATLGDPDADPDSADEYATSNATSPLCVLDTFGADPSINVAGVSIVPSAIKLHATNASAGRAITVSAQAYYLKKDGSRSAAQIAWT